MFTVRKQRGSAEITYEDCELAEECGGDKFTGSDLMRTKHYELI